MSFRFDHRAQVGSTITWIVATIVILLLIVTSLYFSFSWNSQAISISPYAGKTADPFLQKSFFSYLLLPASSNTIMYQTLREKKDFDEQNGPLAVTIFKFMQEDVYTDFIWVGFSKDSRNSYFGSQKFTSVQGDTLFGDYQPGVRVTPSVILSDQETFYLDARIRGKDL